MAESEGSRIIHQTINLLEQAWSEDGWSVKGIDCFKTGGAYAVRVAYIKERDDMGTGHPQFFHGTPQWFEPTRYWKPVGIRIGPPGTFYPW